VKVKLSGFFTALMVAYLFSVCPAELYFNYRYAQTQGFLKWALLGQVVPTMQGVAWPYYALSAWKQRRDSIDANALLDKSERAESVRRVLVLLSSTTAKLAALRTRNGLDPI